MKLTLLAVAVLMLSFSSCLLVPLPGRGVSRSAVSGGSSRPQCHPSQYWDGAVCRHKGKGQGARKHDG